MPVSNTLARKAVPVPVPPQARPTGTADTPPPEPEVCVLLPCRDEAASVGGCVHAALAWLKSLGVTGECLVVDNGSTDDSAAHACAAGARVITEPRPGYGRALRTGMSATRARYVLMADADGSYDLTDFTAVHEQLTIGKALVVGNRFAGGIAPGAMPMANRWLGNPLLSGLARLVSSCQITDWHCGLRGVNREVALRLNWNSDGMEFASEMILTAHAAGLPIAQTTARLTLPTRAGRSHLRPLRDGLRHVLLLLRSSQRTR